MWLAVLRARTGVLRPGADRLDEAAVKMLVGAGFSRLGR